MKIAISGATGMVGSVLVESLLADGHQPIPMVRRPDLDGIHYDVDSGQIDAEKLESVDVVVHLAGHNVAAGRWNAKQKRLIMDSRTGPTRLIAKTLSDLSNPPSLISASAMGFYGSRGDEPVTEATETGTGFLAEVCRAWEAACAPAESAGVRVVRARVGVVLGPSGGALKKMLPIFKLGMGGPMGSGRQYIPWIALTDVVRGLRWLIENSQVEGPVNFTGPEPVTQKVFAQTLGRVLRRPAFMPTPAFALRCMLGREMANEMLLGGANISPKVLIEDGFSFQCPNLEKALRLELDRTT